MTIRVIARVVAIVPAFNSAGTIAATVASLVATGRIDEIVVVDDGSHDETASIARDTGARVVRLLGNRGKGFALKAGVDASPFADFFLFIDADTGDTASGCIPLLDSVLVGDSDMAVGVLAPAGNKGGLGVVSEFARWVLRRTTGRNFRAPLSGQRAITAALARSIVFADGFGVEVAMSIDAIAANAIVRELRVGMDHEHRGRGVQGFAHRLGQGVSVARVGWPRLASMKFRSVFVVIVTVGVALAVVGGGFAKTTKSNAIRQPVDHVVFLAMPSLTFDDLSSPSFPNLRALAAGGEVAGVSTFGNGHTLNSTDAYASLSAGSFVSVDPSLAIGYDANELFGNYPAGTVIQARTGHSLNGEVVVPTVAALEDAAQRSGTSTLPGALGQSIHKAGFRTMALGNSDFFDAQGRFIYGRQISMLAMDKNGFVDYGNVGHDTLENSSDAPSGIQANLGAITQTFAADVKSVQFVAIDSGDLTRAQMAGESVDQATANKLRQSALMRTDALLGGLEAAQPRKTLFVVSGLVSKEAVAPIIFSERGVASGRLFSPTTQRIGIVSTVDVAPTILQTLGLAGARNMDGKVIRSVPGENGVGQLTSFSRLSSKRHQSNQLFVRVLASLVILGLGVVVVLATKHRWFALLLVRHLVLLLVSIPLAGLLIAVIPIESLGVATTVGLLFVLAFSIASVMSVVTVSLLEALEFISAMFIFVAVALALFEGQVLQETVLGSVIAGRRVTGFDGATCVCLCLSTIFVVARALASNEANARLRLGLLAAFIGIVAAPISLGANLSVAMTMLPAAVGLISYQSLRSASNRKRLAYFLGTCASLGGLIVLDARRSSSVQSTITQLISRTLSSSASRPGLTTAISGTHGSWLWLVALVALGLAAFGLFRGRLSGAVVTSGATRNIAIAIAAIAFGTFVLSGFELAILGLGGMYLFAYLTAVATESVSEELVPEVSVQLGLQDDYAVISRAVSSEEVLV